MRGSSLGDGWVVESDEAAAVGEPPLVTQRRDESALTHEPADDGQLAESAPTQVSNAALVLFGVFGGLYILYTWVWMTWAQYYATVSLATAASSGAIGGVLQQVIHWAVPVAPGLWFLCALLMNRQSTGRLAVSLLIGAIVLLPLPMFMSSGAAL